MDRSVDKPADISVFDPVPTQLDASDRRSLLVVQQWIAQRFGAYSYFEVGSFLGGSLQPHLADARCVAVFSVDSRPRLMSDERGVNIEYPDNTTERMIRVLTPAYGAALDKLRTFDMDATSVPRDSIMPRPRMCFVDGEHTDRAVVSDFFSCLELLEQPGVIMFDDANLVYGGITRCIELLRDRGIAHRAYVLPRKIGVIEIGDLELYRQRQIVELLASPTAFLALAEMLDPYRRRLLRVLRFPVISRLRRLRIHLLTRGRPSGGTRDQKES